MFRSEPLLLWVCLAGCVCGGAGVPSDAGPRADREHASETGADGHAEARDASTDATDDRVEAGASGDCPAGEVSVPLSAVSHDDPFDCGDGCRQVTWAGFAGSYDVDGTWLAFSSPTGLGIVDMASGDELAAPVLEATDWLPSSSGSVAVAFGQIVYGVRDEGTGEGRLYRYDVGTQCKKLLRTTGRVPVYIDSNGSFITWMDERAGTGRQDAYSFDLAREEEIRLTTAECCVGQNRVWEDTVVMQYWAGTPRTIAAVPIAGGKVRRLWEDPREQREPAIHGHRVVFTRQADRTDPPYSDIYGFDLETNESFVVSEAPSSQSWPDVHGDLVAWEDDRDAEQHDRLPSIYAMDLVTGEETQVTSLPGGRPRIWERTVFFESIVGDQVQILAFEIPD